MPSDDGHGQCEINWTGKNQSSMPIVSTLRTWGNNCMCMWKTNSIQPRDNYSYWESHWYLQTPFFRASRPKSREQVRVSTMTTTTLQSRWCAESLHKEERRQFTNIGDCWENDLEYRKSQMSLYDISTTSCRLTSLTMHLLKHDQYFTKEHELPTLPSSSQWSSTSWRSSHEWSSTWERMATTQTVAFRVQSDATHWTRRGCTQNALPGAFTSTLFSRLRSTPHFRTHAHRAWLEIKVCPRHSQSSRTRIFIVTLMSMLQLSSVRFPTITLIIFRLTISVLYHHTNAYKKPTNNHRSALRHNGGLADLPDHLPAHVHTNRFPTRLLCGELALVRTSEEWVGPSATHLHSQGALPCVHHGMRRGLWLCRAPVWSCWWLESEQMCLETRSVHKHWIWDTLQKFCDAMATDRDLERVVLAASSV